MFCYVIFQQISFRRNTLELSNDILKRRLGHLQELNDKQDVQISEYITELQDEQRRTHQLINRVGSEPVSAQVTSLPTPLSSTMRCHMSGHNEVRLVDYVIVDCQCITYVGARALTRTSYVFSVIWHARETFWNKPVLFYETLPMFIKWHANNSFLFKTCSVRFLNLIIFIK